MAPNSVNQKRKRRLSGISREFLAEVMGTFILMVFGIASVAQSYLSDGSKGGFLSINIGWGLGVTFGVYWSGGVSGGHLNPAVSLAMTAAGRLPWKKLPVYWLAQSLGAFIASAVCFGVYNDLLDTHDQGQRTLASAGIWSTYPYPGVSNATVFGDQLLATALLVGSIFALTDERNNPPKDGLLPIAVGFLVLCIGTTFGVNVGYGINPARDLIPRLFTAIAGWNSEPLTTHNYFFWIPVLGQLCGGIIGAFLYIYTIEAYHPPLQDTNEENNEPAETPFITS